MLRTHGLHLRHVAVVLALLMASTAARPRSVVVQADTPCPSGQWAGLPALNRFFTGVRASDGSCATSVGPTTFPTPVQGVPNTLDIPADMRVTMENAVTISPGATLTAEAGVAIAANDGSSAIVVQGTFNVNGASGHRVSLTKTDTGQNWGGVEFAPGSGGSLSFMQLSFAVARCASGSQGGICVDDASPTISDSIFDHNLDNGLEVDSGDGPLLRNDQFTNNQGYAVFYREPPDNFGQDSGLSANGNGADAIGISRKAFPFKLIAGVWTNTNPGLPLDLLLGSPEHVAAGASVNFSPGSTLHCLQLGSDGPSLPKCAITVDGPANGKPGAVLNVQRPAVMTGDPKTVGSSWSGLIFAEGSRGAIDGLDLSQSDRGITDGGAASLTISNSSLHNNSYGVGVEGGAGPTLVNDSFSNNSAYAVWYMAGFNPVPANFSLPPDRNLSASGNGSSDSSAGNTIAIEFCCSITGVWTIADAGMGIPVTFLTFNAGAGGFHLSAGGALNIAAGSTMYVEGIVVDSPANGKPGGVLTAAGTASAPVILTTSVLPPLSGTWDGITFQPGSSGTLDHMHLSFAGGRPAGILVDNAAPTITNSIIDQIAGSDLRVLNGGLPVLHNNTFGAPTIASIFGAPTFGVENSNAPQSIVDATNNDWGSASGPSGAGPGTGVAVSTGVNFCPWLGESRAVGDVTAAGIQTPSMPFVCCASLRTCPRPRPV